MKNSRNVRIGIIIIGLLLAVGVNVSLFPWMIRNAEQKSAQLFSSSENVNTEYIDTLYQGAYVLYTEIKNEPSENRTEPFVGEGSGYDDYDYISEWSSSFEGVRSETDYYATDGTKKEVNTNAPLYEVLEPDFRIDDDKEPWNSYESVFVLDFDEDGNLSVDVKKDGTVSADTLIKSLLQAERYNEIRTYAVDNDTTFVPVKNFQVVYGIPKEKTARLESYLFKDNKKSIVYISDNFKPGYQKIITNYSVLKEHSNNSSLLDINIETGKTHQIRAHLAYIGHPIIGDGKYGINSVNKSFGFKYQQLKAYKLLFNFKTDSGKLNYLNGLTFSLSKSI